MRLCTRMRIQRSHVDDGGTLIIDAAELLDISLVDDDHQAGADPDDPLVLHMPGLLGAA